MAVMDNRIIRMQFDNRQFERNIAKSQKSIEDLKEAMNFDETSRGLSRFSQNMSALDFSNLTGNIQKLTDKFTGLGDAGEYVLSRIRYGLESAARSMEGFIKSISVDQIDVGNSKYDALNKAVNTIIASGKYTETEAYDVMERVMTYTSQTSHNFQTMVGQIASLQAVGMKLEDAEHFLEGIANASTKAGAGATEAAGAMSIISKVMGGTNLSKLQFDSLNNTYRVITREWREMAIDAAVEAKTLVKKGEKIMTASKFGKQVEVTVDSLENTLNKKWFTGDVARILYGKYEFGKDLNELEHPEKAVDSFGKTAYLTGQRALTFADALNAIKESVSSGWMETFRIALGDVTEAAEIFTNVCDRVVESLEGIRDLRNDVLKAWTTKNDNGESGKTAFLDIFLGDYWREAETGAVGFLDLLDGLKKIIYDGFVDFMMIFGDPVDRMNMKDDPAYFRAWLGARLTQITNIVEDFMKKIKGFFNEEITVGGEAKTRLEIIHDIVDGIAGALGLALLVLEAVGNFMERIRTQLQPSIDTVANFFGKLGESIFGTAQDAKDSKSIFQFFDDLATKMEPLTSGINDLVESFVYLLSALFGLDEESDKDKGPSMFERLGNVITKVVDILSKSLGPILTFFSRVITSLTDLLSGKIDLTAFGTQISDAFSSMISSFEANFPDAKDLLPDWAKDLFGIGDAMEEGAEGAEEKGKSVFAKLHDFFTEKFGSFGTLISNLTSGFSLKSALENGFGFLSAFNFLSTVVGWFKGTNLYSVLLAFLGVSALGTLWRLLAQAKKAVRTIGGFFDDVGGNLKAGVLGQYEWNSEKVLNFAKGILMIAASIALIGSLSPRALIQGVVVVGLIFGALMYFIKLVGSDKFKATFAQQLAAAAMIDAIAAAVVAIVLSLSILMLAIIPLASDWRKMLTAFLGFTAILAVLGAFIIIMVKQLDHFMVARMGGNGWGQIAKVAVLLGLIAAMVVVISLSVGALMVAMTPLAAMGWQNILAATVGFGLILTAIGAFTIIMLNAMDKFASAIGGGTASWSGIGKMAVMMLLLAGTVALISVGVSALVIALAPLAAMRPESIITATVALGLILAEIGAFIIIMLNMMDEFAFNVGGGKTNAASIGKMAAMMLVLSVGVALLSIGIGMLVLAITPLAAMSVEGVIKAVGGLGVILVELGLFMTYLNKINTGEGASVKLMSFAGFAVSIGLLIFALTPLALMDWGAWGRAMLGLGIVLGLLIAAMKLMQVAKVKTSKLAAFTGFAASIGILMYSLQPLAGMDWGGWGRAMLGLLIVLGLLIGAAWLMDKVKVSTASLTGFIGFALSIAILIYALKPLAEMDQEGYYRAIFGLGTVMLEVIALMAIMNALKPDLATAGTTLLLLLGLGAAMILFGIAFNEVKDVPVENLIGFAGGLAVLLVALAGAAALAKIGGIKGILLVAVGLAAILGVIALMAPLVIGSIGNALTSMAAQFTLISNLMGSVSSNAGNVDENNINKMIRILEKISALYMKLLGFTIVKGSVDAFTEAVAALNLAAGQLQMLNDKLKTLPADGGMVKLTGIVTQLKTLCDGPLAAFSGYTSLASSFSDVLFQLGTGLGTFQFNTQSVEDPTNSNALKTIQALADSSSGLDTLAKMNMNDITSKITGLGGAMMLYAQGAAEVGNLDEFDPDGKDAPTVTAAVALMQSVSESLNEAGGFAIPENMPDESALGLFGASLAALAGALVKFEEAGQGLGTGTEQALKTLEFFRDLKAQLVATNFASNMDTFLADGGVVMQEDKTSELTTFGKNISELAQAMGQFASSTTYMNEETGEIEAYDYSKATEAMTAIAEIPGKMPALGGPIVALLGKRISLTTFSKQIELLGTALKDFHDNTTITNNGITTDIDFSNAVTALERIAAIPEKLPTIDGIESWWSGNEETLTQLSVDIMALGGGLNEFSKSILGDGTEANPGFDSTKVDPAITSADKIADYLRKLQTKMKRVGGLVGIFNTAVEGRDYNLTDLSEEMKALGSGLNSFGNAISGDGTDANPGFDPDIVEPTLTSLETMIGFIRDLSGKLPSVGGLGNIWHTLTEGRSTTLKDVGDEIGGLGEGLAEFGSKVSGKLANADEVTAALDIVDGFAAIIARLSAIDPNIFYENFRGYASGLNEFLNTLLYGDEQKAEFTGKEQISAIDNVITIMEYVSKAVKVASDIDASSIDMFAAMTQALSSLAAIDLTKNAPFENVGKSIATGVATGIENGTSIVTAAAIAMAEAAYKAAMAELDAHSPSKVFMDVGSYIGLGLSIGMEKSTGEVVDSATGMSEKTIQTAGTMMAAISQIMAEGTDANPTITPVLDLSQVEAELQNLGLSSYGGTIGIDTSKSAGIAGQIGRRDYDDENQNRIDLTGVYDHITQLGEQIQQMSKSISNMKLVLNTGIVAGGVTDGVDYNIGRKMFYAERNN